VRNIFANLWADDAGIVTIEYLVLATFLALALIVGVATLGRAINVELVEVADAILTFDQTYSASGFSTCVASKNGSDGNDSYNSILTATVTPTSNNINVLSCQ
jgi:Flp pilus assembly pilin Flp